MYKFFTFFAVLIGVYLVWTQDQTEEEKKQNCAYLNSVRANFTACCEYPMLVIWRWQYKQCTKECKEKKQARKRCCMLPCCFGALGVLTSTEVPGDVNWNGLVYSFLLSVGNDTQWLPVINGSAFRCYNQFSETSNGYDCEVIPMNLYAIIDCCYNENYLKCAKWNPNNIEQCTYTYQYVQNCMDSKTSEDE